ncbi:MAG: hypothetical protein ACN6OP_25515, partial [Pseudomonadales bacterium]
MTASGQTLHQLIYCPMTEKGRAVIAVKREMFSIAVVGGFYFGQKTVPNTVHNPGSQYVREFSLTSLSEVISSLTPQMSFYVHEDSAASASSAIACLAERS